MGHQFCFHRNKTLSNLLAMVHQWRLVALNTPHFALSTLLQHV